MRRDVSEYCSAAWTRKILGKESNELPQMQDSPPLPQQVVGFATEAIAMSELGLCDLWWGVGLFVDGSEKLTEGLLWYIACESRAAEVRSLL